MPQFQRGVGLIEILVAVLILSLGLLGVAMMQTRALSSNNSSMGQSMAVVASYSILDAMRIDRSAALAGSYNGTVTANACPATGTLAQVQLLDWCQQLASMLGAAATTQGTVNCDANGNCTITIQFDDSRVGAGINTGTTQQIKTKVLL